MKVRVKDGMTVFFGTKLYAGGDVLEIENEKQFSNVAMEKIEGKKEIDHVTQKPEKEEKTNKETKKK